MADSTASAGFKVKWDQNLIDRSSHEAKKDAVTKVAAELLREANRDVPYREGILMGSGYVDVSADPFVDRADATVSYDTPYAVRLHENPQYHFNFGRKGKWLEDALNGNAAALAELMMRVLRSHLGMGV